MFFKKKHSSSFIFSKLCCTPTSVTNNSNNSINNLDLVQLNLYSEKVNCAYHPLVSFAATPREATCHVTAHARPTSSQNTAIDGRMLLIEMKRLA